MLLLIDTVARQKCQKNNFNADLDADCLGRGGGGVSNFRMFGKHCSMSFRTGFRKISEGPEDRL